MLLNYALAGYRIRGGRFAFVACFMDLRELRQQKCRNDPQDTCLVPPPHHMAGVSWPFGAFGARCDAWAAAASACTQEGMLSLAPAPAAQHSQSFGGERNTAHRRGTAPQRHPSLVSAAECDPACAPRSRHSIEHEKPPLLPLPPIHGFSAGGKSGWNGSCLCFVKAMRSSAAWPVLMR